MSGKNSSMEHKRSSFTALWDTIEAIYGEIPEIIKIILQFNGFDSFLALKGIRYDDKNEFFNSLESTINEMLSTQDDTEEKKILNGILSLNHKDFRLKPGHKNLIMNLMLEIDKVDVEEFFNKAQSTLSLPIMDIKFSPQHDDSRIVAHETSACDEQTELDNQKDFEEEYILEDYTLDDKTNTFEHAYEILNPSPRKKKSTLKRKPNRMYNEQFLSQCINPRKRRVAAVKTYSDNDEGVRERFSDLIQQVGRSCI